MTDMQPPINDLIIHTAGQWGLEVRAVRKDIEICGSPERCEFRCVLECGDGGLYVLERLSANDVGQKQRIIDRLNYFSQQAVAGINPYLATAGGAYIIKTKLQFWQMSRYVNGIPLNRPDYVFVRWRALPLANFLIQLHKKSENVPGLDGRAPFSIIDYIHTLNGQIQHHRPELHEKIQAVVAFLNSGFFTIHDRIPSAFCHGDYHALNVIWSDTGINAVIDWEFCGIKPEIYDIANMIGCIGVENPEALAGPLVLDFIDRIRQSGIISDISWPNLIDFVIALRFAWLSEWLRNNNEEMIELETVYMGLLLNNARELKQIWKV